MLHLLPPCLQMPLARRPSLGLAAVRCPGLLECAVGPRRLAQLALELKALALCRGGEEGRGGEVKRGGGKAGGSACANR